MSLTSGHVLTIPGANELYVLYTDASFVGLGCACVLMQKDRVVVYGSYKLKADNHFVYTLKLWRRCL